MNTLQERGSGLTRTGTISRTRSVVLTLEADASCGSLRFQEGTWQMWRFPGAPFMLCKMRPDINGITPYLPEKKIRLMGL
jgi:hypothetical protein